MSSLNLNYSSSENDDDIKGCYTNEPEYLEKEIKRNEYSGK